MNTIAKIENDPLLEPVLSETAPDDKELQLDQNTPQIDADESGELDRLEDNLALELEKEFVQAEVAGDEVADDIAPVSQTEPDAEVSARILDNQRKRLISVEMEERIRESAGVIASLSKQASILTNYLEKAESDLKKLEKVEANATKLRIASEGICRKNHQMKTALAEQKKRISLLEAKIGTLRESNETARTNLARLLEEKRIATVDIDSLRAENVRLENDKRTLSEKLEMLQNEQMEMHQTIGQMRDKERGTTADIRTKDETVSRITEELEDLRSARKQTTIELEELKSRNVALESKNVEMKSRNEELMFDMESGRKELEEIIRLKQQRILELEARGEERLQIRHELTEEMTPSTAFDPAREKPQALAKPAARTKAPAKTPAKPKTAAKA